MALADTVAITLLRHGITMYNVEKRYLGWTDIPLNGDGRGELVLLRDYGGYPNGNLFVCSDLERCKQTMETLYPNEAYLIDNRFREFNFGDWEGLTYEQLKNVAEYQNWLNDFNAVSPPNGEVFSIFNDRVVEGWKSLFRHFENININHIVVVSHGGPIRLLLMMYAPLKKNMWEWDVGFGAGYTFTFERRGGQCTLLQAVPLMERASGFIKTTN